MQHRYNLYANTGDRRIPSLIEQGNIGLDCINPGADTYRRQYSPDLLWEHLQNEGDLSRHGLYLSLYCTEHPAFDGKQWFLRTAYNANNGGMRQERSLEVKWVNVEGIQFWNTSFRDYARIHQARSIIDYTVYISRVFGYCFMLGLRYNDDEDDERQEFTTFYPSMHHYHQAVAMDETRLYQPFNDELDWIPTNYPLEDTPEDSNAPTIVLDELPSLATAVEGVTASMRSWENVLADNNDEGVDLSDLIDLGEDIMEDEEEGEGEPAIEGAEVEEANEVEEEVEIEEEA